MSPREQRPRRCSASAAVRLARWTLLGACTLVTLLQGAGEGRGRCGAPDGCLVRGLWRGLASAATVTGPIVFVRDPSTGLLSKSGPDRVLTPVPDGELDIKYCGVAVDSSSTGRVFWSDGARIRRSALDGSGPTTVMAKLVLHVIGGVNFGAALSDVSSIKIRGVECTSLQWWSSKLIGCTTASTTINAAPALTPAEVVVTSRSGGTSTSYTNSQAYADARLAQGYSAPLVASVTSVTRSSAPSALAYDVRTAAPRVFWSDNDSGSVFSADGDGEGARLLATGVFEVHGLAADGLGHLFYTDANAGTVVKVALDSATNYLQTQAAAGVDVARVVTINVGGTVMLQGLDRPRGIAVDAPNGHVYFTEASGRIYRARADGRNMEASPLKAPRYAKLLMERGSSVRLDGIAVTQGGDGSHPKSIYWAEANTNSVWRASIYGQGPTKIAGASYEMAWPRAVALRQEAGNAYAPDAHLFWSQYLGRVWRAAGDGTGATAIVDELGTASGYHELEQEIRASQATMPHFLNAD